jgi:hypothetical protein
MGCIGHRHPYAVGTLFHNSFALVTNFWLETSVVLDLLVYTFNQALVF